MANASPRLLEQFVRGEPEAIAFFYRAYTPYLRSVVRRLLSDRLRSKFDSADVVQSVWVQVIEQLRRANWEIRSENELRALLATIARRRLATRVRRYFPNECPADPEWSMEAVTEEGQPRPSEVAQGAELWDRMLLICPPEHRHVLIFRREGMLLADIATRTGLHEGSVRRILREVFRDLALQSAADPATGESES